MKKSYFHSVKECAEWVYEGVGIEYFGDVSGRQGGIGGCEERSEEGEVGKMEMKSRLCSG